MFSEKNNAKSDKSLIQEQNRIAAGTKLTGDLVGVGSFRIEGFVKGDLRTKGKVVVSPTGKIEGSLECESADIAGEFKGKMHIFGTLSLQATAKVSGTIKTAKLAVEPGAVFNVSCEMLTNLKSVKNEKQTA